jgi:hypothetical protein
MMPGVTGTRGLRPISASTIATGPQRRKRPLFTATIAAGVGRFTGLLANEGGFLLIPA